MNKDTTQDESQSHKGYEIFVNTRKKLVESEYLTYEQVVHLAFDPPPSGPNILIRVKFSDGPRGSSGSLVAGQRTKIADGMVFDVRATDQS